jgi:carboxypeptidase family protein
MLRTIFRNQHPAGLVSVYLFVALAPSLMAQTPGTGALTGRVTDPSGAGVANVTVTVTSVNTSQTGSTTTGTDGTYKLDGLPPGNYRVKFEASGFKTVELPSAVVNGTEAAVLDTKLEMGEVGNAIPVYKPAPVSQENLPNAPSSSASPPSLQDLGFPQSSPRATPGSKRCSISGRTC